MRVHIDNATKQILGYYPEPVIDADGNIVEMYTDLPSPLITVPDDEYQQALEMNANKWDGGPSVDTNLYPPAPPPPTLEERISNAGLTMHDIHQAYDHAKAQADSGLYPMLGVDGRQIFANGAFQWVPESKKDWVFDQDGNVVSQN